MEYMTVRETAQKWNMSERFVQRRCTEGRIEGAVKFGISWMIPADTEKPADLRGAAARASKQKAEKARETGEAWAKQPHTPMPLMNAVFTPGFCMDYIEKIEDKDARELALAEYYYLTGKAKKAVAITEKYLDREELALKLTTCLIYAFSSLSISKTQNTRRAIKIAEEVFYSIDKDASDEQKALSVFSPCTLATLLHLKRSADLPELHKYIPFLPAGLQSFALYTQSRYAYINGLYAVAIGIGETTLVLNGEQCPIPAIYLHLVCAMGYMHTKYPQKARQHIQEAWKLAKPDNLIGPFAELHGFLGGMLEAVLKREAPNDFRRIINITGNYLAGWCEVHNAISGDRIPTDLTATQFTISMLAARGWSNPEIAAHLGISEIRVKQCVSAALQSVNASQRAELADYFLP